MPLEWNTWSLVTSPSAARVSHEKHFAPRRPSERANRFRGTETGTRRRHSSTFARRPTAVAKIDFAVSTGRSGLDRFPGDKVRLVAATEGRTRRCRRGRYAPGTRRRYPRP